MLDTEMLITIASSALISGVVAMLVTFVIERCGGVVGGILGTMPWTIAPATIGLARAYVDSPEDLDASLFSIPPGLVGTGIFLSLWKFLPDRMPQRFGPRLHLTSMIVTTLGTWFLFATGLTFFLRSGILSDSVQKFYFALASFISLILFGIWLCLRPAPASKVSKKVTLSVYFLRGTLAALSVGGAVALSKTSSVIAGIASVFPAIFLTTMVSLWVAHGKSCPAGAAGPMTIGTSSVGAYCLLFAGFTRLFSLELSVFLSWITCAFFVSLPIGLFVQWRYRKLHSHVAEHELQPVSDPCTDRPGDSVIPETVQLLAASESSTSFDENSTDGEVLNFLSTSRRSDEHSRMISSDEVV